MKSAMFFKEAKLPVAGNSSTSEPNVQNHRKDYKKFINELPEINNRSENCHFSKPFQPHNTSHNVEAFSPSTSKSSKKIIDATLFQTMNFETLTSKEDKGVSRNKHKTQNVRYKLCVPNLTLVSVVSLRKRGSDSNIGSKASEKFPHLPQTYEKPLNFPQETQANIRDKPSRKERKEKKERKQIIQKQQERFIQIEKLNAEAEIRHNQERALRDVLAAERDRQRVLRFPTYNENGLPPPQNEYTRFEQSPPYNESLHRYLDLISYDERFSPVLRINCHLVSGEVELNEAISKLARCNLLPVGTNLWLISHIDDEDYEEMIPQLIPWENS